MFGLDRGCNPTNPRGPSYPLACPSSHIVHISQGCHSNPVDTRDRQIRFHCLQWMNACKHMQKICKSILCGGWLAGFVTVNKRLRHARGQSCGIGFGFEPQINLIKPFVLCNTAELVVKLRMLPNLIRNAKQFWHNLSKECRCKSIRMIHFKNEMFYD